MPFAIAFTLRHNLHFRAAIVLKVVHTVTIFYTWCLTTIQSIFSNQMAKTTPSSLKMTVITFSS